MGLGLGLKFNPKPNRARISKELLKKMKDAGCQYICYGIESGNDDVLRNIKKGITREKASEVVRMTRDVGIDCTATFIIGSPTETFSRVQETIEFAASLPLDSLNFYNLIPYPGTELYEYVSQHGHFLMDKDTYLEEGTSRMRKPVFETDDFPRRERLRALSKAFSLARKKMMQHKFGKPLGTLLWLMVRFDPIYFAFFRFAWANKKGRTLYNWLKKGKP